MIAEKRNLFFSSTSENQVTILHCTNCKHPCIQILHAWMLAVGAMQNSDLIMHMQPIECMEACCW